jgi:putative tryptophan/tyrosine transport system substrate-binding protein
MTLWAVYDPFAKLDRIPQHSSLFCRAEVCYPFGRKHGRDLVVNRRDFITLLGCAAAPSAAWPRAAWAQQSDRIRRVGLLMGIAESDPEGQARITAFRSGLGQLGWQEGNRLAIDARWAGGDASRTRAYAAELVSLSPDAILATNTPTVRVLQEATQTIPIVFVSVSDPVSDGFVKNLSSPGANITGFSTYDSNMAGKWLQLLKDVAPQVERVAIMFNPDTAPISIYLPSLEAAAPTFAVKLIHSPVRDSAQIENAIASLGRERGDALITLPDSFTIVRRSTIIRMAEQHRIPAIYSLLPFAKSGGLMSYGTDTIDQYRQAASYIDRILKGAKPANLPIQQPTKFKLVINLKTAKALGLTIPPSLLAIADEVIE